MPANPYKPDEKRLIRQFLDGRKADILSRIRDGGAKLQDCTVERFISIILPLVPEGSPLAEPLNDYRITRNNDNKRYFEDYLQELKNDEAPAPVGVPADGSIGRKGTVTSMFRSLRDATAADAAKCDRIDERPLCCAGCGGYFYHKTTDGPGGSRYTGGAASKVSLFYEKHGEDYYLVAWGVHAGKTTDGKDAVYQVKEAAPGCALRPGNILRPPGR